ncbi:hypothetical protein [Pontibacter harenae]|uniref:hypothetical protein n=1 Tax=Pontibacter harenae TaxID=2894083 RepID=UPI001E3A6FD9|nr:hypothetical protein [Pontibacter harenae]MCC9166028.1 hypothetical protein [Pontibacter harenae]
MRRVVVLLFLLTNLVKLASGQATAVFDNKLYTERLALCDLTSKFIGTDKDFNYHHFGPSFYSVSTYGNRGGLYGRWAFVVRNDSLNQISFTSLDLPITAEAYDELAKQTEDLIEIFTAKYGQPAKATSTKKNAYQKDKKPMVGAINKAMWLIDGQKLKVEFFVDGEHGDYHYTLRILRFEDYYSNMKLPAWWDGY